MTALLQLYDSFMTALLQLYLGSTCVLQLYLGGTCVLQLYYRFITVYLGGTGVSVRIQMRR